MSIRCPDESLRRVQRVPTVCAGCGYLATLDEHDEALDRALISNTYLQELRHELILLERTERFFERFPASKHRLKVSKLCQDRKELREVQDDSTFENALRAEPQLYEFLTANSSFRLPTRLREVRKNIQQLRTELDVDLIKCPTCKRGRLMIEHDFFQRL